MKKTAAIVLAAGRGSRIKSYLTNKVIFPLAGKPMILYCLEILKKIKVKPIIIVVGFRKKKVKNCLGRDYLFVNQGRLLGTGHAVKKALPALPAGVKDVLVIYGDHSFFYEQPLLIDLLKVHRAKKSALTFITVNKKNPTAYGRVLRNNQQQVIGIREEKDASAQEKKIREINTGTYCFSVSFLKKYLPKIKKNQLQGEYYLTDLVELAVAGSEIVSTLKVQDEAVAVGVNTKSELLYAEKLMQKRQKL